MTPPTYTPLSRAGFEAIGIAEKRCGLCEGERIVGHRHIGYTGCPTCKKRGYTGPDITGVLANDPPARNQADVEAAVEWLGSRHTYKSQDCCEYGPPNTTAYFDCESDPFNCSAERVATRLLAVEPREAIRLTCHHIDAEGCCTERCIDGLIIVGGESPLNPDHVAHLIQQAESAGVPVWLHCTNWFMELSPYDWPTIMDKPHRQLPAAMGGGS